MPDDTIFDKLAPNVADALKGLGDQELALAESALSVLRQAREVQLVEKLQAYATTIGLDPQRVTYQPAGFGTRSRKKKSAPATQPDNTGA